jgi:hypothetical protein
MNLIRLLHHKLFLFINMMELSRKRYLIVASNCQEELRNYPHDYSALYIFALCEYYKKNIDSSYNYFKELVENHRVKNNILKWFLKNIIAYQLYYKKQNELTKERCIELLKYIKNRTIEIEVLKLLCVAYVQLNDNKGVLETCKELRNRKYIDDTLKNFEEKAKSALM